MGEGVAHVSGPEGRVTTMLGDLKNPKYAGEQSPIQIKRCEKQFTRIG